jgi:predicted Fe-Mo cluster-binding NifX family protein
MKIAVSYENGEVFQHLGHTEQFKIYEVINNDIKNESVIDTNGSGHGALADFLVQNDVDVVICGKFKLHQRPSICYGGFVRSVYRHG